MHEHEQMMMDEILEISELIETWNSSSHPEVQWAIQLLELALAKRLQRISPYLQEGSEAIH